jgi:hypothetical protein
MAGPWRGMPVPLAVNLDRARAARLAMMLERGAARNRIAFPPLRDILQALGVVAVRSLFKLVNLDAKLVNPECGSRVSGSRTLSRG